MTAQLQDNDSIDGKTIGDFGVQWRNFGDTNGWWSKAEGQLLDQFGPLLGIEDLKDKNVADIGSGMGRIVSNLIELGCAHVTAIEPSPEAFAVLKRNTEIYADKITYINAQGDEIPKGNFDLVLSLGVLHHIVDPAPVVRAAHAALGDGGKFLVWLYGKEGNGLYLTLVSPLLRFTSAAPTWVIMGVSFVLTPIADFYTLLCRFMPLPMGKYFVNVYARFNFRARWLALFDQLHTTHAKYYTRTEAQELLENNGFTNIKLFHRHGYSWSVIGEKANDASSP